MTEKATAEGARREARAKRRAPGGAGKHWAAQGMQLERRREPIPRSRMVSADVYGPPSPHLPAAVFLRMSGTENVGAIPPSDGGDIFPEGRLESRATKPSSRVGAFFAPRSRAWPTVLAWRYFSYLSKDSVPWVALGGGGSPRDTDTLRRGSLGGLLSVNPEARRNRRTPCRGPNAACGGHFAGASSQRSRSTTSGASCAPRCDAPRYEERSSTSAYPP